MQSGLMYQQGPSRGVFCDRNFQNAGDKCANDSRYVASLIYECWLEAPSDRVTPASFAGFITHMI